jgi:hypothetical protein
VPVSVGDGRDVEVLAVAAAEVGALDGIFSVVVSVKCVADVVCVAISDVDSVRLPTLVVCNSEETEALLLHIVDDSLARVELLSIVDSAVR